jgi:cellobiose phosphorylase
VVHEVIQGLGKEFNTVQLGSNIQKLQATILSCKEKPDQWYSLLENLRNDGTTELGTSLLSFVESHNKVLSQESLAELRIWIEQFSFQIYDLQREMDNLAPWIGFFHRIPEYFSTNNIDSSLTEMWKNFSSIFIDDVELKKLPDIFTSGAAALRELVDALEERRINDLDSGLYPIWAEALNWCKGLYQQFQISQNLVYVMMDGWQQIEVFTEKFIKDMDFRFLFDKERQVFHIGYNVESEKLDSNYYDLFASEARIASLVAIAKGDVPDSHWLHLARPFTVTNGATTLLSWSATMFEYLMPSLFFKTEENTLTGLSIDVAIKAQKIYAKKHAVPWGISESAFYHFDSQLNYQYQAFGVPGLGLKRGLDEDLVISPYSSLIALEFDPKNVLINVEKMDRMDAKGLYGYYDAIDFTPGRAQSSNGEVVKTYMAHHQGMILLSLVNFLTRDIVKNCLLSDPRFYTVNLLLYETIPQKIPLLIPHNIREPRAGEEGVEESSIISWNYPGETPVPQVHILSNGDYSVMITNAGTGYSQWKGVDLTRWRPDTTLDNQGTFIFVRDLDRGKNWSATFQPIPGAPHQFSVQYEPNKASYIHRADDIVIETSVCIAPDDPVEIRKVQITNHSNKKRNLQIFSYGEVILNSQIADRRHPAFNKLFIDSDFDTETKTLIYSRRQRTEEDGSICLGHCISAERPDQEKFLFCSDREQFIGRGGNIHAPKILKNSARAFDNTFTPDNFQAQLDPIFCAGIQIEISPHTSYSLAFLTIAEESRLKVNEISQKYQNWSQIEDSFTQALNLSRQNMKQLELSIKQLKQYHQLLSLLLYPNRALRANVSVLAANELGQSSLWQYAVSGDYPILLIRIESETDISILTELINAFLYYRSIDQMVDLVIFNDHDTGYNQEMQNLVFRLINRIGAGRFLNQRGGIFLLRSELIPIEQRILFETCARVMIRPNSGSLDEQLEKMFEQPIRLPMFQPALQVQEEQFELQSFSANKLLFFNGLGGFSKDGKEYCMILEEGKNTPAPWINVIANERFGYWISESGMGTTWAENSGENKITTWNNDPLIDNQGEAIYLRDEDSGRIWSPSPLPCRAKTTYFIRHGQGYSVFENSNEGIITSLTYSIAKEDPVKFALLRVQNVSNRIRRISATYYAEWALGPDRDMMRPYIITEFDTTSHTLLARNPYNTDFKKQVAFLTATRSPHGVTGSRVEFLGRNGNFQDPAAMRRVGLASTIEAGMDPCAAFQQLLWLAPGEVKEVTFLLGCGKTEKETEELISKYQDFRNVKNEMDRTRQFWEEISSAINVKTPEPSLDLLLNYWLPYQALGCRIWGRSAMYQSSGAFGFRDQLQDVLALQYTRPEYVRSHIIESARRQFIEGDVLHWWHPPFNRGVRTRCSDDLLWLPYVLCNYIDATGDLSILDEKIPFLQAAPLRAEETERYDRYQPGENNEATLLEHCRRAIEKGCTKGKHGLPLMGSHDWNDGMNRVGIKGKGESVWMGWFLIDVLNRFSSLCEKINRKQLATLFMGKRDEYINAIQANAWDGVWYLRAFYDNGEPMGSNNNTECRIDAIAQSWAVISGAADYKRRVSAMNAVWAELVKEEEGIVLLFTPSFNQSDQNPGYIKGYKPGIRENGGQYTHASTWTGWAFADMGDTEKALKVFRMISPIYHSDTYAKVAQYRVEPYVVAADVYGEPPFTGRGGWTWYTGSAGWLYRLGLEKILGFKKEGESLIINPAIPHDWNGYQIDYKFGSSRYSISVMAKNTPFTAVTDVILDEEICSDRKIPLKDDGKDHFVKIIME